MNNRHFKKYFSTVIFIFLLGSYAAAEEDFILRIGICRFESNSATVGALADGVSSSFYETMAPITEHRMGRDEIIRFLIIDKELEINEKLKSLESKYAERDDIIFNYSEIGYEEKLSAKDVEIESLKADLQLLEEEKSNIGKDIEPDTYSLIPVEFMQPQNSLYFSKEAGEIAATADKNDLDMLVYGLVEELDEYRYIEVRVWNSFLEKDTIVWRTAVGIDDVNKLIVPGQKAVKTDILGKDWSGLTVRGPDNCMIYIDGLFSGIGGINGLILEPGEKTVEIKKSGYESHIETILLEKYSETLLNVELEVLEKSPVIVQTFPAGADVYLDSEWMGKSPLQIEMENEVSAIKVKKDGYADISFFTHSDSGGILNIDLKASSPERDEWVPDRRKRFYTSFGSSILSIPLTALFFGMLEQTSDAYNREYIIYEANAALKIYDAQNIAELLRLQEISRAQYTFYLCSLGLNIFLVLDTIIQAVDYVDSVEYFSN